MKMITYKFIFKMMLFFILFFFRESIVICQSLNVGIVTDYSGECYVYRAENKPISVYLGLILQEGDTLITKLNGKIRLLIWDGDKKKTIFRNSNFILKRNTKSPSDNLNLFSATTNFIIKNYKELANIVVKSERETASIKGMIPGRGMNSNISIKDSLWILYPRNEKISSDDIIYSWKPIEGKFTYKFSLWKNNKIELTKETQNTWISLDYEYEKEIIYYWQIESVELSQKEKAHFEILSDADLLLMEKDLIALENEVNFSERQIIMIKAFINKEWNLFSKSFVLLQDLNSIPNSELWEIQGFQWILYRKMGYPENEAVFSWFLNNYVDMVSRKKG